MLVISLLPPKDVLNRRHCRFCKQGMALSVVVALAATVCGFPFSIKLAKLFKLAFTGKSI